VAIKRLLSRRSKSFTAPVAKGNFAGSMSQWKLMLRRLSRKSLTDKGKLIFWSIMPG
jgi:hypothetical protein